MITLIFLVHFVSCALMTGVIWIIQRVHYPSFHYVPASRFPSFVHFHGQRIFWIVMPLMLVELSTAAILWWQWGGWLFTTNLLLNLSLFGLTFFCSMPLHQKLAGGKDQRLIDQLVGSNWPRTFLWSLRLLGLTAWFEFVKA